MKNKKYTVVGYYIDSDPTDTFVDHAEGIDAVFAADEVIIKRKWRVMIIAVFKGHHMAERIS